PPPAHFHRNPPGCASFGRLSRGRGIAHRLKTTPGILPLNASPAQTCAHPAKIFGSVTTPVTDLVH
ncbi:MAG TPA: hypothetical protein VN939_16310, partial [Chthoniobacterales bacterium]|nr:hypothetical protein [Chthoniobacterales bacterium]